MKQIAMAGHVRSLMGRFRTVQLAGSNRITEITIATTTNPNARILIFANSRLSSFLATDGRFKAIHEFPPQDANNLSSDKSHHAAINPAPAPIVKLNRGR